MPSVQIHADVIDSISNTPERQDSTGRRSASEGQPLVTAGTSSMAANASAGAEAQEVTATPSPPAALKQKKWSLAALFRGGVEEESRLVTRINLLSDTFSANIAVYVAAVQYCNSAAHQQLRLVNAESNLRV
jgi:hypothetical protein